MLMTKGNLLNAKSSLKLAKMGYELMDRKHIILMRELSEMLEDASVLRQKIDTSYERAYLALQKANITMGKVAQLADRMPLDNEIDIKFRSVMGVEIPKVSMVSSKRHFPYSLSQSNSRLDEAYLEMQKVKENTVKLAQIDVGMFRLWLSVFLYCYLCVCKFVCNNIPVDYFKPCCYVVWSSVLVVEVVSMFPNINSQNRG